MRYDALMLKPVTDRPRLVLASASARRLQLLGHLTPRIVRQD